MEVWGGGGYRGGGVVKKEAVEIYETTYPKKFFKKISPTQFTLPHYTTLNTKQQ
ncbi:MAG: hypothetical protein RIR11_4851 [Bacteroidota bacterium]|jgi:serine/threonine protein phosphatase PrpC